MAELWSVKLTFIDKVRQRKCIKRLKSIDKKEWLSIWNELNSWKWPEQLDTCKPRWWRWKALPKKTYVFTKPLIEIIDQEFSEKEHLRFHNVAMGRMKEVEFDYWYYNIRGNYESELFKKYYDRVFVIEAIEWWKDDVFNAITNSLSELTVS